MAYRKGEVWVVNVPVRRGPKVRKHVGTPDKGIAQRGETMCDELAHLREWKLLEAITGELREDGTRGEPMLEPLELYDAWHQRHLGTLDKLRERLDDVDLESYISEWLEEIAGRLPAHSGTPARYEVHVR